MIATIVGCTVTLVITLIGATWVVSALFAKVATKTDIAILATRDELRHEMAQIGERIDRVCHTIELADARVLETSNRVARLEGARPGAK